MYLFCFLFSRAGAYRDGIADFIDDEGDCVWSNSEVVGQAWIIVTAGQVS
jgi:hypothetical protein